MPRWQPCLDDGGIAVLDLYPLFLKDARLHGDPQVRARYMAAIDALFEEPGGLTFWTVRAGATAERLERHAASVIVTDCPVDFDPCHGRDAGPRRAIIQTIRPRLQLALFSKVFRDLHEREARPSTCWPGAFVSPYASIDNSAELYPGAVIYGASRIGAGCRIGPNAVVGCPGFSYEWNDDTQSWAHLHHVGRAIVGDRTVVGASSVIDRGSLSDTVVGPDCLVDSLVHIGHNVRIDGGSFVASHTILSGSVRVGERCWIAPAAAVRDGCKIGDGALIGTGAVVTKDVKAGATVAGVPARRLR